MMCTRVGSRSSHLLGQRLPAHPDVIEVILLSYATTGANSGIET